MNLIYWPHVEKSKTILYLSTYLKQDPKETRLNIKGKFYRGSLLAIHKTREAFWSCTSEEYFNSTIRTY